MPERPRCSTSSGCASARQPPDAERRLAQKNGVAEKLVLACLCTTSHRRFIRGDHGYWAAQMLEPTWTKSRVGHPVSPGAAVLRRRVVGYAYPNVLKLFGGLPADPYIQRDYAYAREHKWYMSARLICINTSTRSILPAGAARGVHGRGGRHFKQPKEGSAGRQPLGAHVAHHHDADEVPLIAVLRA